MEDLTLQKDIVIEVRQVSALPPQERKTFRDGFLQFLEIVPKVGWLILATAALIAFRPIIEQKLKDADKINAFGIALEVEKKIEVYNSSDRKADSLKIGYKNKDQIIARVKMLAPLLDSHVYKILWVDDNPVNNLYVSDILEQIGFKIDNAGTTESALAVISETQNQTSLHKYDVVITDYTRTDTLHDVNGLAFANQAKLLVSETPVIFYSSSYDETKLVPPPNVYAIAHRPEHLINYVLDAVERGNTPLPPSRKY